MAKTDALSKILPGAHSSAPPPVKSPFHPLTSVLEASAIGFGPSFSWRLSTMPERRSVHSRSKVHLPIPPMMGHEGFTRAETHFGVLRGDAAFMSLSLSSVALRQQVLYPCLQHLWPHAWAGCVLPMPSGPMKAMLLPATRPESSGGSLGAFTSLPWILGKPSPSEALGPLSGSLLGLMGTSTDAAFPFPVFCQLALSRNRIAF